MDLTFRIKICGITNVKDALESVMAGADAIGLNFYRKSLRCVSSDIALSIVNTLAEQTKPIEKIGVFVNASANEIREISELLALSYVQLHGDEIPEMMRDLEGLKIIRAIRVVETNYARVAEQIRDWSCVGCETFLLDAAMGSSYGGTGKVLDWPQIPGLRMNLELTNRAANWILAGGLTQENVAEAIRIARPDAVDVASGVEGLPGKKDPRLIQQFVKEARRSWN